MQSYLSFRFSSNFPSSSTSQVSCKVISNCAYTTLYHIVQVTPVLTRSLPDDHVIQRCACARPRPRRARESCIAKGKSCLVNTYPDGRIRRLFVWNIRWNIRWLQLQLLWLQYYLQWYPSCSDSRVSSRNTWAGSNDNLFIVESHLESLPLVTIQLMNAVLNYHIGSPTYQSASSLLGATVQEWAGLVILFQVQPIPWYLTLLV